VTQQLSLRPGDVAHGLPAPPSAMLRPEVWPSPWTKSNAPSEQGALASSRFPQPGVDEVLPERVPVEDQLRQGADVVHSVAGEPVETAVIVPVQVEGAGLEASVENADEPAGEFAQGGVVLGAASAFGLVEDAGAGQGAEGGEGLGHGRVGESVVA
jgi:hypothetical protein